MENYWFSLKDTAYELNMKICDVRQMLEEGELIDNGKKGKNQLVLWNEAGPQQPRELLEFAKAKEAFQEYLQAIANRRNKNVDVNVEVKICTRTR